MSKRRSRVPKQGGGGDKVPLPPPPPLLAPGSAGKTGTTATQEYSQNHLNHDHQLHAAPPRTLLSLGIDLGGSLTKVCYFEPQELPESGRALADYFAESVTYGQTGVRDEKLSFYSPQLKGRFHFIYFESSHTSGAIDILKSIMKGRVSAGSNTVHATGGGAVKFAKLVEQELGIQLVAEDELETVVRGIVFTLVERASTGYTIPPVDLEKTEGVAQAKQVRVPRPIKLQDLFPLLVVNIGSGVSIIKVDSPDSMRRVSGTAVGGGTFFGLCKLLTRCATFDEALDAADRGDSRRVNLLVSDIYGGGYDKVGLPGSLTASFFGKVAASAGVSRPASSGSHEDVLLARRELMDPWWIRALRQTAPAHAPVSALMGVGACHVFGLGMGLAVVGSVLVATAVVLFALHVRRRRRRSGTATAGARRTSEKEIVYRDEDIARALVTMVAQNITQLGYLNCKVHGTNRIVFTGNFLRHNSIALRTLSENLRAWSGGGVEALFLEHEGFFGAIGAFLASNPERDYPSNNVLASSSAMSAEVQTAVPASALVSGGAGNSSAAAAAREYMSTRPSSFHAPEEGDDGYFLNSPQSGPAKKHLDAAAAGVPELRLT